MSPAEESQVQNMTFQERLAHFSPLLAEHKITWNEYAYIMRKIPYRNDLDEKVKDIATLFSAG